MRDHIVIEDRLHAAGYQTERCGGVVRVHDPIHAVIGQEAVITGWKLEEIRTVQQAWAFIEARG
ncbi:MAG: hypothetical protein M0003_17725 [Acidithiobacillus sp.]|nr:hypothetical protein [Acidithiobacillus sp.]